MGKDVLDVDGLLWVLDVNYQPVMVSFDVEHSEVTYRLGRRVGLLNLSQIVPSSLRSNAVPGL